MPCPGQYTHRLPDSAHGLATHQLAHGMWLVVGQRIQYGCVELFLKVGLALGARNFHGHVSTRRCQYHRQFPDGIHGTHAPGTLYPVVPPELLVDHVVAQLLLQHRVFHLGHQFALFLCKRYGIHVFHNVRRAHKGQLGLGEPVVHVRKIARLPDLIKVLMGKVVLVHGFGVFKALYCQGLCCSKGRFGGKELFYKFQGRGNALLHAVTGRAVGGRMLRHEVAHWCHGRPAGKGVVADVQHTAQLQFFSYEIHDGLAVGIGNPAPDAVQTNEVKIGQVRVVDEILEAVVVNMGLGNRGQICRKGCL